MDRYLFVFSGLSLNINRNQKVTFPVFCLEKYFTTKFEKNIKYISNLNLNLHIVTQILSHSDDLKIHLQLGTGKFCLMPLTVQTCRNVISGFLAFQKNIQRKRGSQMMQMQRLRLMTFSHKLDGKSSAMEFLNCQNGEILKLTGRVTMRTFTLQFEILF